MLNIDGLFTNRFEGLRSSLANVTLDEVAQFLQTEAEFVALQKPSNAFLARIFWNTVLAPVLTVYRDVTAREREIAEGEVQKNEIVRRIEAARVDRNATPETLMQHARDFDCCLRRIESQRPALNEARERLTTLLNPAPRIQHVP